MSLMPDAQIIGSGVEDAKTYLVATVANRGTAATTITHMVLYNYPGRLSLFLSKLPRFIFKRPRFLWRWFVRRGPKTFVATTDQVPRLLEPGRNWQGMVFHTPEIEQMIADGRLFAGIIGSHSDKPLFRRVRRWIPPNDAQSA